MGILFNNKTFTRNPMKFSSMVLLLCTLTGVLAQQEIATSEEAPAKIDWAAKKAEWSNMTDEEKAAKKAAKKAEWASMTDEEKAAKKA